MAIYTITSGAYDSYRILVRVQSTTYDEKPIKELKQEFDSLYYPAQMVVSPRNSSWGIWESVQATTIAHQSCLKVGLKGNNLAECFVDWLISVKKFVRLKSDEFYVDWQVMTKLKDAIKARFADTYELTDLITLPDGSQVGQGRCRLTSSRLSFKFSDNKVTIIDSVVYDLLEREASLLIFTQKMAGGKK